MPKIKAPCNVQVLKKMANLKENLPIREKVQVICLAQQGLTIQAIAHKLDRGVTFVKKWVQRYNEGGVEGLWDLPRCGPPPKITPQIEQRLLELAQQGPPPESPLSRYRAQDLVTIIFQEFHVSLGESTVRMFLKKKL